MSVVAHEARMCRHEKFVGMSAVGAMAARRYVVIVVAVASFWFVVFFVMMVVATARMSVTMAVMSLGMMVVVSCGIFVMSVSAMAAVMSGIV